MPIPSLSQLRKTAEAVGRRAKLLADPRYKVTSGEQAKHGVMTQPLTKVSRDGVYTNDVMWFNPHGKSDLIFELVKDAEPNSYSIHFKTDLGALSEEEKAKLFTAVAAEIPAGATISTYGTVTPGGVHGVLRFGTDFGWKQVGTRSLVDPLGEPVRLGVYLKPFHLTDFKPILGFDFGKPLLSTDFTENPQTEGIHLFKRPYSLREIKEMLTRKHKLLSDYMNGEGYRYNPKNDDLEEAQGLTPFINVKNSVRYKHVDDIDRKARQAGSQDPKIYGVVYDDVGPHYSGLILGGLSKATVSDPQVKLMMDLNNNLPLKTQLKYSPAQLPRTSDIATKINNSDKTPYIYFSDIKSSIRGYHNNLSGNNFVNLNTSEELTPELLNTTRIHESIMHETDKAIANTGIQTEYEAIIEPLKHKLKLADSKKWSEMRATLGELKAKYTPEGDRRTLHNVIYGKSDEEILSDFGTINGYSEDYVRAAKQLGPETTARLAKNIRYGLLLPALAAPVAVGIAASADLKRHGGLLNYLEYIL